MLHKSHERLSLAESWSLKGNFDVCNWRWVYLKQGLQVYECQEGGVGVGGGGGGAVACLMMGGFLNAVTSRDSHMYIPKTWRPAPAHRPPLFRQLMTNKCIIC